MKRTIGYFSILLSFAILLTACGESAKDNLKNTEGQVECTIWISVNYEKVALSYNDDAIIYVDDEEIGRMEAGKNESFDIIVKTGAHSIYVKRDTMLRHSSSSKIKFEVNDNNQEIIFSLKDDSIKGFTISLVDSLTDGMGTELDNLVPIRLIQRQEVYAAQEGASLNRIKGRNAFAEWFLEQNDLSDKKYIQPEGGLLSESKYKLTMTETKYQYYGETKNNYADGFGILFMSSDGYSELPNILYMGNFSEGYFSGYGIQFAEPDSDDQMILYKLCNGVTDGELYQTLYYDFVNYAKFEGIFDDGKASGKGNKFTCALAYYSYFGYFSSIDDFSPDEIGYEIVIGEFKNGKENGKVKNYNILGGISYDGEMKDGSREGKGTLYYSDGETIKYDGEFKNDKYEGTGTLYDESGQVVYSGKWENGEYA